MLSTAGAEAILGYCETLLDGKLRVLKARAGAQAVGYSLEVEIGTSSESTLEESTSIDCMAAVFLAVQCQHFLHFTHTRYVSIPRSLELPSALPLSESDSHTALDAPVVRLRAAAAEVAVVQHTDLPRMAGFPAHSMLEEHCLLANHSHVL